jgi:hypothetical protein
MERKEEVKMCQQTEVHSCAFEGEPTIEDCLFCLPVSAISSYRSALMRLGAHARLPFGDSYMIYAAVDSAAQKSGAFARLMEEHRPEIYKRSKNQTIAIIVRPHPLDDKNPLTM